ncbi:MAG: hypothetical protein RL637_683 [Pseudomonadota bacterium]|jgi:hypothetical protein
MKSTIMLSLFSLFLLAVILSGCSEVSAWQRGHLAKPHMAVQPHPLQVVLRGHIYGSREAALASGANEGGGGCGCY